MQTYLTFVTHPLLWVFAGLLIGFYLILWATSLKVPSGSTLLSSLRKRLGLESINPGLFLIGVMMWAAVFLLLFAGLMTQIADIIQIALPTDTSGQSDWRFAVAKLTAMTAVLGAVVAFPVTLLRLDLSRAQTETAIESLFNDKINAASDDLHAMRQRWDQTQEQNIWEADIARRNAAIDRLEGLTSEKPDEAPRVVRMLGVYVREMSREVPPEEMPPGTQPEMMEPWARALTVKRSDMQNAVQTIGRMRKKFATGLAMETIDLSHCNLQAMALSHDSYCFDGILFAGSQMQGAKLYRAQLQGALLSAAQMQGANLGWAQMQGANLCAALLQGTNLGGARMQGANLGGARMQGANLGEAYLQQADLSRVKLQGANLLGARTQGASLNGAQIQGAKLAWAQMQGTNLSRARMDDATSLVQASLRGAWLKQVDLTEVTLSEDQVKSIFGDGSVILPGRVTPEHPDWPAHFPREELGWSDFVAAVEAWWAEIGFDPKDPATW